MECYKCGEPTSALGRLCKDCRQKGIKRCTWCGEIKVLEDFKKRTDTKSGRASYCRDCVNKKQKAQRLRRRKEKGLTDRERVWLIENHNLTLIEEIDELKTIVQERDAIIAAQHKVINKLRKVIKETLADRQSGQRR